MIKKLGLNIYKMVAVVFFGLTRPDRHRGPSAAKGAVSGLLRNDGRRFAKLLKRFPTAIRRTSRGTRRASRRDAETGDDDAPATAAINRKKPGRDNRILLIRSSPAD